MAAGESPYDDECTRIRQSRKASGVILIVVDGDKGTGYGAQLGPIIMPLIPQILRNIADQVEADLKVTPVQPPANPG